MWQSHETSMYKKYNHNGQTIWSKIKMIYHNYNSFILIMGGIFFGYFITSSFGYSGSSYTSADESVHHPCLYALPYNSTYPMSPYIKSKSGHVFKIAVITDLDEHSRIDKAFKSYFLQGKLSFSYDDKSASVRWEDTPVTLQTQISAKNRGAELSDLAVYNGELLTVDDRTGIIYRIYNNKLIPWVLLSDGDGNQEKGFKAEWLSVKNQLLYVGGLGKEWTTTTGDYVNNFPQWIKVVDAMGSVRHVCWEKHLNKLREKAGMPYPGYMIHESVQWSPIHKKWFFLPRRASGDRYDETADESRGTNLMLTADEKFETITLKTIGNIKDSHRGFSAFTFIPDTGDTVIVALKSEERNASAVGSYIMVFDIHGHIIMDETRIPGIYKYEGIEFV